jgi:hypothetical protein
MNFSVPLHASSQSGTARHKKREVNGEPLAIATELSCSSFEANGFDIVKSVTDHFAMTFEIAQFRVLRVAGAIVMNKIESGVIQDRPQSTGIPDHLVAVQAPNRNGLRSGIMRTVTVSKP